MSHFAPTFCIVSICISANGEWPEPGRILKIALGAGAAAPTYVNEVELDNGERGCKSSVAHDG